MSWSGIDVVIVVIIVVMTFVNQSCCCCLLDLALIGNLALQCVSVGTSHQKAVLFMMSVDLNIVVHFNWNGICFDLDLREDGCHVD